jgi:hypothetical protein
LGWIENKSPLPDRRRIPNLNLLPTLSEQALARSSGKTFHPGRIEQARRLLERDELNGHPFAGTLIQRGPNRSAGRNEGHLPKRKPLQTRSILVGRQRFDRRN